MQGSKEKGSKIWKLLLFNIDLQKGKTVFLKVKPATDLTNNLLTYYPPSNLDDGCSSFQASLRSF